MFWLVFSIFYLIFRYSVFMRYLKRLLPPYRRLPCLRSCSQWCFIFEKYIFCGEGQIQTKNHCQFHSEGFRTPWLRAIHGRWSLRFCFLWLSVRGSKLWFQCVSIRSEIYHGWDLRATLRWPKPHRMNLPHLQSSDELRSRVPQRTRAVKFYVGNSLQISRLLCV